MDPPNSASNIPILKYEKVYTHQITDEQATASPLLRALALSPDGQYVAGAFDRHVTIWRFTTNQDDDEEAGEEFREILNYRIDQRSTLEEITSLSWTKTGYILIGSNVGDVKIVLLNDEETILKGFQVSNQSVKFMMLDQEGDTLAVVAGSSEIGIWKWLKTDDCWTKLHFLPQPEPRLASDDIVEVTSIHWDPSGGKALIVSYLNHGILCVNRDYDYGRCIVLITVRKWDVESRLYQCLLTLDKVYGGALSLDGRHFAVPNRKGTFDIYDLSSRDKLDWFNDPDLQDDQKNVGLRTRPGIFIHGGRYFVGASFGKVNIWNTARSIRGQRLSLAKQFTSAQVTLLAVSDTSSENLISGYRIAACTQGPRQEIDIWKASGRGYVPSVQVNERLESAGGTSSKLVTGMLIGGLAVHAAGAGYLGLF